jgi:hypothetical protein
VARSTDAGSLAGTADRNRLAVDEHGGVRVGDDLAIPTARAAAQRAEEDLSLIDDRPDRGAMDRGVAGAPRLDVDLLGHLE